MAKPSLPHRLRLKVQMGSINPGELVGLSPALAKAMVARGEAAYVDEFGNASSKPVEGTLPFGIHTELSKRTASPPTPPAPLAPIESDDGDDGDEDEDF